MHTMVRELAAAPSFTIFQNAWQLLITKRVNRRLDWNLICSFNWLDTKDVQRGVSLMQQNPEQATITVILETHNDSGLSHTFPCFEGVLLRDRCSKSI